MQVLHPVYGSTPWYHRSAAVCILVFCLGYTILIWYILRKRCLLDGEQCSYVPIGQIQDLDPPAMAVFALPSSGEGADNLRRTGCVAYLRSKKGDWHGGRAEDRAAALHDRMVLAVFKFLELWKASPAADVVVGDLVPQVDGELPPSGLAGGLAGSVSKLEDAYTRIMRRPLGTLIGAFPNNILYDIAFGDH